VRELGPERLTLEQVVLARTTSAGADPVEVLS
jgi:hypothetical protein